ncbi:MAG: FMN-binding protein [Spirochaetes bacterium]|nr:MAG: FMN-binding protein [Spirochaetota bacterium]
MKLYRNTILAAVLCACVCLPACASEETRAIRALRINDVDLSRIPDGVYEGSFSYGSFNYLVRTTVKKHRIANVEILKNRDTVYARKAEGVVGRVLEKQTPNVDAVSGATTTSKALLKAIEYSLAGAGGR